MIIQRNFINKLFKTQNGLSGITAVEIEKALNEAQKVGATSCSFEGARGMMQENSL